MPPKKKTEDTENKKEEKEKILKEVEIELMKEKVSEKLDTLEQKTPEVKMEVVQEVEDKVDEKKSDNGTQEDKSFFSKPIEEHEKDEKKKGKKGFYITVITCTCLICLILGFIGGFLYTNNFASKNKGSNFPNEELLEKTTPTPTVEEVNLSSFSIQILNGSGVAGVAGSEEEALNTDGFNVEDTGNAPTQDFTETTISFKKNVPESFREKLKNSVSQRYVISSDSNELDSSNTYDVVITLGSETVVDE